MGTAESAAAAQAQESKALQGKGIADQRKAGSNAILLSHSPAAMPEFVQQIQNSVLIGNEASAKMQAAACEPLSPRPVAGK